MSNLYSIPSGSVLRGRPSKDTPRPVSVIKHLCVQCGSIVKTGESRQVGLGLFKHKECRQVAHVSQYRGNNGNSANFKQQLPTTLTKKFNSPVDGTSMKGLV